MFFFRRRHYLLICDRILADKLTCLIAKSEPSIRVSEPRHVVAKRERDAFWLHELSRDDGGKVELAISVTGTTGGAATVEGEYWVFIDSAGFFSSKNIRLADDVRTILLKFGARE